MKSHLVNKCLVILAYIHTIKSWRDVVDHYLFELCNHLSYVCMCSMMVLLCLDTNIIV